ncbi:hypothetical protein D5282_05845 [bacterium 1xD8-48]|nr:hypothetical protein [bacterium 1xD8-48]
MKGKYIAQIRSDDESVGAVKKIYDQIEVFTKHGYEMELVNFKPSSSGLRKTHLGKGICASIPLTYVFAKYHYSEEIGGADFYYIRFEAADVSFCKFLKQLRTNNLHAKIIIEFPDYPNTYWMNSILHIGIKLKDYHARPIYKKYVDRFAIWNDNISEIYGVPTIKTINGIKVDRIPLRNADNVIGDEIHVIGVATMFAFHGFDRLIKGMISYYEKNENAEKLYFHVVGDGPGPELKKYLQMVEGTKAEAFVIFEGKQSGENLNCIFDKCDLAIGSLGMHRIGYTVASSLKSREYLARGLAIVTGCPIDILLGTDFDYVLEFPADESDIDINSVVAFYKEKKLGTDRVKISKVIRQFAIEHCDMEVAMKEIIQYIEK